MLPLRRSIPVEVQRHSSALTNMGVPVRRLWRSVCRLDEQAKKTNLGAWRSTFSRKYFLTLPHPSGSIYFYIVESPRRRRQWSHICGVGLPFDPEVRWVVETGYEQYWHNRQHDQQTPASQRGCDDELSFKLG